MIESFFHNFIHYKNFFSKKLPQTVHIYELLKWCDVLIQQGFKYNHEMDHYAMVFLLLKIDGLTLLQDDHAE